MIKAIFSDLDGTLLSSYKDSLGKILSKANQEAIKYAQDKGVRFVFATGRLPFGFENYANMLNVKDYIASNGSIVSIDGKLIKGNELDYEVRKKVLDFGIENNCYERIFSLNWLYLLNPELGGSDVNFYLSSGGVSHDEAKKIIEEKKIYKMSFYSADNIEYLKDIRNKIENMHLNIETCYASSSFLEINPKNQSKGQGIIDYCAYTGIDPKEVIAIGDNENDISMLKVAGIGACPSNATKEVKQVASYVAKASNDEDAVKEIIERFVK